MSAPMIAAALALLAAGQTGSSNVTALSPGNGRRPPGAPAATMMVEPIAMALAGWDANGDGRTTRAEMIAGVAASFAAIAPPPAASFGYLGYGDWAERFLGDRNALPSPLEVDTDGDDRIALTELQAAVAGAFDRLDRNHDGAVSRAELLTIRSGIGGPGEGGPGRRGGRSPR